MVVEWNVAAETYHLALEEKPTRRAVSRAGKNCDVANVVALSVAIVGVAADAEVVENPLAFAIHHPRHLPHHRHRRRPCS